MPGQHRRRLPLIKLLAKLGWQRDPDLWTVPCRDRSGRRARLLIRLTPSGITLNPTALGPLHLTALEVGRLCTAARDAIRTCDLLADPDHTESPPPLDPPPAQRETVYVERVERPAVWDLQARYHTPSA